MRITCALPGFLSACVAGTTGTTATAQGSSGTTSNIVQKGAVSGAKQLIAHFIQVTPSCETMGYAVVRITRPPTNGRALVEQGDPTYNKDNVRFSCDSKKVPSVLLFYTSNPGYTGTDTVIVDAVFVDGALMHREYTISVQ